MYQIPFWMFFFFFHDFPSIKCSLYILSLIFVVMSF